MAKGIKILKGKKTEELEVSQFKKLIPEGMRVLADLGTGDGLFALRYAEAHPETLVLAIDAAAENMKDTAAKAQRNRVENVLFIWSAVEKLPAELAKVADEITINFPWGNLLADTIKAEPLVWEPIINLGKKSAPITINLSYQPEFEQSFINEYALPELSHEYLEGYFRNNVDILGAALLEINQINPEEESIKLSTWPKRILDGRKRKVWQLKLRIWKEDQEPARAALSSWYTPVAKSQKTQSESSNRNKIDSSDLSPVSYTFMVSGHPAIKATHVKTLEFTKDADLTERGDCIIGIKADFDINELKKFTKKVKFICSITTSDGETITSEFKAKVNQNFNSDHELVLRKSGFDTERTFGFGLNRGANHLDRRIVELMQNPQQKMQVTIQEGWS